MHLMIEGTYLPSLLPLLTPSLPSSHSPHPPLPPPTPHTLPSSLFRPLSRQCGCVRCGALWEIWVVPEYRGSRRNKENLVTRKRNRSHIYIPCYNAMCSTYSHDVHGLPSMDDSIRPAICVIRAWHKPPVTPAQLKRPSNGWHWPKHILRIG